ncbi:d-isomer specific 2-hydroxyacid dehydrogenase, NAD binding domain-containing protein [Sarocladium implicatum]|jgi:phosphoglycerate dehydrogenase-like enzyme|nr:d-isomer specific 2-hydroxyacid dehydrogenase, NAD binding domain-containing protein [Sarocladium implicatum]
MSSKHPKVLYPTNIQLDIPSLVGYSVELVGYDPKDPIPEQHHDAVVLITWMTKHLADAAKQLKSLRWIQALAAGVDDILGAGFNRSRVTITTGGGTHDVMVAEHTLAMILSCCRRMYEMRDYQNRLQWPAHLGGAYPAGRFKTLRGANVLVWGFGGIAKTVVPHLQLLGANVKGVARSAGVRDGIQVFTEDNLPELLRETDCLLMILPASSTTVDALNAERIALLPDHAWVINVGRGVSVDEEALADALEGGKLGGAALDVFKTEPLPESSRLWKAPNLVLSPHAAGGRPEGCTDLIAENLRMFLAERPLKNAV